MIIARAPFRVSFCGGGSDLPVFYEKYGGCCLSTSIKKYMYISLHKCFHQNEIILKYSKTEIVNSLDEIEHRIFRQCLYDLDVDGVELTSMADVPSGTGLGSSSAFTVALLKLLHAYKGEFISDYKLAKDACEIEISKLKEPIGKQDQYASAFGGLNFYEFMPDGFVKVEPVVMKHEAYQALEKNLLLFYLGGTHSASEILARQGKSLLDGEKARAQLKMCELARELRGELQGGDVDAMGRILDESWKLKRTLASGITSRAIDEVYETALDAGALGGKLLGAGGAGFMLLYVKDEKKVDVRTVMMGYPEMEFEMDNSGCTVIFYDREYS